MILIDRVRSWLNMHVSMFSQKPDNGRGSVQELDMLLADIGKSKKKVCDIADRVEDDTAALQRVLEQRNAAATPDH